MKENANRIDVHHHYNPKTYTDALYRYTSGASDRVIAVKPWTLEKTLTIMDDLEIDIALLSITNPGVDPIVRASHDDGLKMCRIINEEGAELCSKNPRFGVLATLPFPDFDACVEEARYALDVLHLDGVVLMSNYGDKFLGDPEFDDLFDQLNKSRAVVHVHPVSPPPEIAQPKFLPFDFIQEFTFNTTRAGSNLVFSGTMERCPNVRIILAHAGGCLPYLTWRIEMTQKYSIDLVKDELVAERWASLRKPASDYFAQFYYDTALSTNKTQIESIRNMDPSHLLFGTDAHYAPEYAGREFVEFINNYENFDDDYRRKINYENAYALFPRFNKQLVQGNAD